MRGATFLVLVLTAGLVSCSGDRVRLQALRGQVLFNDQPLDRAMVAFHPLGEYPANLPKPIAYTDVEGRFKMTTNIAGDGVPAGEYAVTVEWREKSPSGVEKIGGKNLLPPRYSKAESSPLRCTVAAGQDEVAAFRLTE